MQSQENNLAESQRPKQQITNFLSEEDSVDSQGEPEQGRHPGQHILSRTIRADVTSNRKFLARQTKLTLILIGIIMILKILPSPLIISKVENDPTVFDREPCDDTAQKCGDVGEGYQTILLRRINPLQRQLKYFVRLNKQKLDQLVPSLSDTSKIDLNDEITWVQIYASRNGQIYGSVIYEKDGQEIYQVLFDNQPLIFIGEVHVLDQQSYSARIYKVLKTVKVPEGRQLGEENNMTQFQRNRTDVQRNTTIVQPWKNSTINETYVPPPLTPSNNTDPIENQTKIEPNQTVPPPPSWIQIQFSVPLTVEMVRYSQFYTVAQLVIRYVTFLFILYVRSQTTQSPWIFHIILVLVSNPLIFIEIAFPNRITNSLSSIFSSSYIAYLAVFLFYRHRKLKDPVANIIYIFAKSIAFVSLWIVSIVRQMHLVNQTKIQLISYILLGLTTLPLLHHLWRLFFFRLGSILHRNMLFISLTIYYILFLFLSGYQVNYGWKKISFYLIVQAYGIQLCYLTSPVPIKSHQPIKKQHALPDSDPQRIPKQAVRKEEYLVHLPEVVMQPSSEPFVEVQ